jgi:phosphoenolpyruvate-protein phosphotransferase (PTS system enzyme I)
MKEITLKGSILSEGLAIGNLLFFSEAEDTFQEKEILLDLVDKEVFRFKEAVFKSRLDIKKLQKTFIKQDMSIIVEILNSHLEMLYDPWICQKVEEKIRLSRKSAESAFIEVMEEFKKKCDLTDPFFKERMKDIIDISRRILNHLRPFHKLNIKNIPFNSIVLTDEITPSDIVEADLKLTSAFVTQKGGHSSHAAIIARAKNIPYIANVDIQKIVKMDVKKIIVDAKSGFVIFNPTKNTLKKYEKLLLQLQSVAKKLEIKKSSFLQTKDKINIKIHGNIGRIDDINSLLKNKAEGVGLFRSEYLFLSEKDFPSEDMQYLIYKKMAKRLKKLSLVIRIFDFGADKNYIFGGNEKYSYLTQESNPALGCRGIRFLLKHPDILNTQIRAILRASYFGNIRILVPMLSDIMEFIEVKKRIQIIKKELLAQKTKIAEKVDLGCMIEVPSSAMMVDDFAKEADFLSIGTNDLTQYLLAIDSSNPNVSYLYSRFPPALLRMLNLIVKASIKHKKRLILCGEIAADPKFTKLLLGLGIREFSLYPRNIPLIRNVIRKTSAAEATKFFKNALKLSSIKELEEFILK